MNEFLHAAEPLARAATATIANAIWEDACIFLIVALVVRFWRSLNAATRYAVWFLALAAAIVVPIVTTVSTSQSTPLPPHTPMLFSDSRATHTNAGEQRLPVSANAEQSEHARSQIGHTNRNSFSFSALHIEVPGRFALGFMALWALAALIFFVRLVVGLVKLEGLKKNALPLPIEHREAFTYFDTLVRGGRDVRLCVSNEIEVPVAVGLFDSMILIPHHLLDSLSQTELEQICLHEVAHLRRADDWMNLFQRIASALTWFSPGIYAITHWLDLEREVACDDSVIAETGAIRPYAQCLTRMAEITAWPHAALTAPGVFVTRRGISERIERLLRAGRNATKGLSFAPTASVLGILIFLGLAMRAVAPTAAAPSDTADTIKTAQKPYSALPAVVAEASPLASSAPNVLATNSTTEKAPANVPATKIPSPNGSTKIDTANDSEVHVPGVSIIDNGNRSEVHVPGVSITQNGTTSEVHTPGVSIISKPGDSEVHVPGFSAVSRPGVNQVKILGFAIGQGDTKDSDDDAHPSRDQTASAGCTGCNLSNVNWSGRDLQGQNFTGSDLTGAKLVHANLSHAQLSGVNLAGADLRGADLRGASLTGCSLAGANLHGAILTGASVTGCEFTGAKIDGSEARDILRACSGCDMSSQDLSGADLSGLTLSGDNFESANLRNVNFKGASLSGVNFANAKLDGALFAGATLSGCNLHGVDPSRIDFSKAKLTGIDFSS